MRSDVGRLYLLMVLFLARAAWPAEPQPAESTGPAPPARFVDRVREKLHVSGTLGIEGAVELRDGDLQKFEGLLEPEFELSLPHESQLTVIPRLRWDPADNLAPGQPSQDSSSEYNRSWNIGDTLELELREAYLQTSIQGTYLTIGKQQVVWGEADGLKVLDVVDPQDYREFILDEFDDSRIPLWTVKAEIPIKSATLQLLWIPDPTHHRIPEAGATYEFVSNIPQAPPGIPVTINDVDRPSNPIGDSDVGAQLSAMIGGWDVTFNYLFQYDDIPVLYRTINAGPGGPSITVGPAYERTHVIGGSFSNAFGDLTLRGELAYKVDKHYPVEDAADPDGINRTDELEYVIGLDWFGFSETVLSAQFFQSILTSDAPGMLRDQVENNLTFLVQRDFLNDALVVSGIWIQNINHGDGVLRPSIKYEVRSNLEVSAGVDWFYGNDHGLFGQFGDATRLVLGMKIGF